MEASITLQNTDRCEWLLCHLLNGVIGTEAQRCAIIRILKQIENETNVTEKALEIMRGRAPDEFNNHSRSHSLHYELADTKLTVNKVIQIRKQVQGPQDPVESYKSP